MENEELILAKRLYDTYCEAVGGVAFNGDKLPNSEEFFTDNSKIKQREAWKMVAFDAGSFYNAKYNFKK